MLVEDSTWADLQAKYPAPLVEKLKLRIKRGESFELRAEQLAAEAHAKPQDAKGLLDTLVSAGALKMEVRYYCACEHQVSKPDIASGVCPNCNRAFQDLGPGIPEPKDIYIRKGIPTRDVQWVLALHGMNTTGAWQEEFAWLISKTYGYSVPVAVYKYGVVRPGAILRFRQHALMCQLIKRIKRLSRETDKVGFGGRPDVIAHSFGTWLLGHALQSDPCLRVGRVILAGCILRPDFDWKTLINRGQVEAVLCHYGTKDFWARVAYYLIPDSGPSGRRGFNDQNSVIHVAAQNFRHSDFFNENLMPEQFNKIWQPFLTQPEQQISALGDYRQRVSPWRQSCWLFRATILRYWILLLAFLTVGLSAIAFAIGVNTLFLLAFS